MAQVLNSRCTNELYKDIYDPAAKLEALKSELNEAKKNENKELANKIRQRIWLVQDAVAGVKSKISDSEVEEILKNPKQSKTSNCGACKESTTTSERDPKQEMQAKLAMKEAQKAYLQKKLRKLNKKLSDINTLKTKHVSGDKLEKTQLLKIKREKEILDEIDNLEHELFLLVKS